MLNNRFDVLCGAVAADDDGGVDEGRRGLAARSMTGRFRADLIRILTVDGIVDGSLRGCFVRTSVPVPLPVPTGTC